MLYAQFYQYARYPAGTKELIEACGDRSVIIYDGRVALPTSMKDVELECKARGYRAFAMFKGESFTRSRIITLIKKVDDNV